MFLVLMLEKHQNQKHYFASYSLRQHGIYKSLFLFFALTERKKQKQ